MSHKKDDSTAYLSAPDSDRSSICVLYEHICFYKSKRSNVADITKAGTRNLSSIFCLQCTVYHTIDVSQAFSRHTDTRTVALNT